MQQGTKSQNTSQGMGERKVKTENQGERSESGWDTDGPPPRRVADDTPHTSTEINGRMLLMRASDCHGFTVVDPSRAQIHFFDDWQVNSAGKARNLASSCPFPRVAFVPAESSSNLQPSSSTSSSSSG